MQVFLFAKGVGKREKCGLENANKKDVRRYFVIHVWKRIISSAAISSVIIRSRKALNKYSDAYQQGQE